MSEARARVLVADPISEDGVEELRRHFDVDVHTGQSSEQLLERIPGYEALVVRSETKVRAEHSAYGKVMMLTKNERDEWWTLLYDLSRDRVTEDQRLNLGMMVRH